MYGFGLFQFCCSRLLTFKGNLRYGNKSLPFRIRCIPSKMLQTKINAQFIILQTKAVIVLCCIRRYTALLILPLPRQNPLNKWSLAAVLQKFANLQSGSKHFGTLVKFWAKSRESTVHAFLVI